MIMFYSTVQAHIHCLSFATLVSMFRLLVIRWHSFKWHNSTEKSRTKHIWSTSLQMLFLGVLLGKGMWHYTTMNVDPHIIPHLKDNELWHSNTCHICWSCFVWSSSKEVFNDRYHPYQLLQKKKTQMVWI